METETKNLTISDEAVTKFQTGVPAYSVVFGDGGGRALVTITPDGRVEITPGVSLDKASLAFWRGIEVMAPGACQRILDKQKEDAKREP